MQLWAWFLFFIDIFNFHKYKHKLVFEWVNAKQETQVSKDKHPSISANQTAELKIRFPAG